MRIGADMVPETRAGEGKENARPQAQASARRLDFFMRLTEARLAFAEGNLELAKAKFSEVLKIEPENSEAMDFIARFDAGTLKAPESRPAEGGSGIVIRRLNEQAGPRERPKSQVSDYMIREIFIRNNGGLLVGHFTNEGDSVVDKDVMIGMLTAMQLFIQDTFDKPGIYLKQMNLAQFEILMASGKEITVYAIVSGTKTYEVGPQLERFVKDIEDNYLDKITKWRGRVADLRWLQALILQLITGGYIR